MIYNQRQKERSMNITEFPLDDLSRRCSEETKKFVRRVAHDTQYCFELFRRALADHVEEAVGHIYTTYEPQILRWVNSHKDFPRTDETAEYFCQEAFRNFYFASLGGKFARFANLAKLLAYLRICVYSAVNQYIRDHPSAELLPEEFDIEVSSDFNSNIETERLWKRIDNLLPEEKDRILVRCTYVLDMRPREIAEAYPEYWPTAREASIDLHRIRKILMKDPTLNNWLKGDDTVD